MVGSRSVITILKIFEFPFSDSLSGSNFTIDGLYINRPETNSIGLFGFTNGASLENIGLTNVSIIGGTKVGALSGYNLGSIIISGCHSSGNIGAEMIEGNAGRLIGYNMNSDISDSFSNANVDSHQNVGWLTGTNRNDSVISNSYNTGSSVYFFRAMELGRWIGWRKLVSQDQ